MPKAPMKGSGRRGGGLHISLLAISTRRSNNMLHGEFLSVQVEEAAGKSEHHISCSRSITGASNTSIGLLNTGGL